MKASPVLLLGPCLVLAAALPAQNHLLLPASAQPANELPDAELTGLPLMAQDARVQMFFDATETGSTNFVADEIALRYDGPIPAVGAPGPFTIGRLVVRVGKSQVAMPTADFGANLTQPLTTVHDGPWTYWPDDGSGMPQPWGGPNGSLTFAFSTPVPIALGPGEWFVVEMIVEGNGVTFAHAILDSAATTGGPENGTATTFGQGCEAGPGQPPAAISTFGLYAPGTAHHVNATGIGSNAIAVCAFGVDDQSSGGIPLPLTLPGTDCTFYFDPILLQPLLADPTGAITGVQPAATLSMPADTSFNGLRVFEQVLSLVPAANSWGFVLTNAAQVDLGTFTAPGRGTVTVMHDTSATALYANDVRTFGFAMRVRTL